MLTVDLAKLSAILPGVSKPAQYAGSELNETQKELTPETVRFAFAFPDAYEVGMSHLGMKILYHLLNQLPDVWCERVFAPWVDMEAAMRAADLPLFALESRSPVADFDIIGFTLQYEMSYTNILNMLDLAGLPVRAADRPGGPLVIAGGPCAFNPEPLAGFIDAFVLGDGEEVTPEIVGAYRAWRASGEPKSALLERLAGIEGVYVPSLYRATEDAGGHFAGLERLSAAAPECVRKRIVRDLNEADYPDDMIVPYHQIVHDRIMLEVARGCTRGCRFCQAGILYRPQRERSVETLLALADKLVDATGYEELSLSSLSTGDYSCLPDLARELMRRFEAKRVSLSLPSLRIDSVVGDALEDTSKVRKSSLTFAPEAGTQRLRTVINKGVTEEDLIRSVADAFSKGYSSVKLYFMIGLPTETEDDLRGIADLARKVVQTYDSLPRVPGQKGVRVSVSASSFVPKPHTPFQWFGQNSRAELIEKQRLLKRLLKIRGVDFTYHEPDLSFLEAAFARGDRKLGNVLHAAWKNRCTFDGWSERFRVGAWMDAFASCGIDPETYANRDLDECAQLPWDHIDSGVSKEFLLREWHRALSGEATADCKAGCNACGLQGWEGGCPCA